MSHASHLDRRCAAVHRWCVARSTSELTVSTWAAATFGAVLASYSAFRPVRDSIVLDRDADRIPWLFTATLVVALAATPLWGRLVAKGPRHLVAITFHVFAACVLGFAAAIYLELDRVVVGRVFYVWASVFSLFVVSVFWSLLADLLGPARAQRLYGPIAAGGTVGSVIGPALTTALVDRIGIAGVLVMSGACLELAVIGVGQVRRAAAAFEPAASPVDPPVPGGAFDGITHVARSAYLRNIVGYVLCTSCAATFIYLAQAHIVQDAIRDPIERTKLFASIDLWISVATLVVQLVLAGPLIRRLGPGIVLCVLPVLQALGISLLVAMPAVGTVIAVQIVGRTATHGLTRPARELLFAVVERDDKYRAKNAIDTVGYRLGDFGSSWIGQAMAGAAASVVVVVAGSLALCWIALATMLGAGFRKARGTNPP